MNTVRLLDDTIFQVGKILCVARNYRSHATELGNEPPSEPVFFLKPASSIIGPREKAVIPPTASFVITKWNLPCLSASGEKTSRNKRP